MTIALYEHDFYAWTKAQAVLLRAGKLSEIDIENIAEEIESMGRGEKRELTSRLAVLLCHLMKWQFQPELRSTSWRLTIEEQRERLVRHLRDNPSLSAQVNADIVDAYSDAVRGARRETGLPKQTFPQTCPYTNEQMFDIDFYPET